MPPTAGGTGGTMEHDRPRRPTLLTAAGISPHACDLDSTTGCKLWRRAVHERHGRPVARFAYERAVGPVPPGHVLEPTCPGGRRCVEPAHRRPVPRRPARARLDDAKGAEIRRLAATRTLA